MRFVLFFMFFCIQIFSQQKGGDSIIIISDIKHLVFNKCNETKKIGFLIKNNSDKEIQFSDFSYTIFKENQIVREKSMGYITMEKKDSENKKIIIPAKTTMRDVLEISMPWKLLKDKLYFYDLKKGEEYGIIFNKLPLNIKLKITYNTERCNNTNNAKKIFIE